MEKIVFRYRDENGELVYSKNGEFFSKGKKRYFVDVKSDGTKKYIEEGRVNQRTSYKYLGIDLFVGDVVMYKGEPCIIILDKKTHQACFYSLDKTKVFLKDVSNYIELVSNMYENNELSRLALSNLKEILNKNNTAAEIRVYGFQKENQMYGSYHAKSELEGIKLGRRYKYENVQNASADILGVCSAIKDLLLNGSQTKMINVYCKNKFMVQVINNKGIIEAWKKNGWKTKEGKVVTNPKLWNYLLDISKKINIKGYDMKDSDFELMKKYTFDR